MQIDNNMDCPAYLSSKDGFDSALQNQNIIFNRATATPGQTYIVDQMLTGNGSNIMLNGKSLYTHIATTNEGERTPLMLDRFLQEFGTHLVKGTKPELYTSNKFEPGMAFDDDTIETGNLRGPELKLQTNPDPQGLALIGLDGRPLELAPQAKQVVDSFNSMLADEPEFQAFFEQASRHTPRRHVSVVKQEDAEANEMAALMVLERLETFDKKAAKQSRS